MYIYILYICIYIYINKCIAIYLLLCIFSMSSPKANVTKYEQIQIIQVFKNFAIDSTNMHIQFYEYKTNELYWLLIELKNYNK